MLSNSQKEHLTYTAIGQVVTLVAVSIFAYQYIIPGISALSEQKTATQKSIDTYESTVKSGIEYASLAKMLEGKPERAELVKIIQSDTASAQEIIKKTAGVEKEYLEWLKGEIGKTDEEKKNLTLEKAKLNSIIPTMSPLSGNIEEENITLKQYVNFIENTILKRFNFDSNVVIGMQGITFGTKGGDLPENLGMFEFRLDFKGTNADITRFIDYVNTAGKPDILSNTGAVSNAGGALSVMSNPLITMENFSLQDKLDADNPAKENSGRATLRFYVRGISKDDITYLKENLKARQEALRKRIEESVKACEKDPVICASYNKKIVSFQKKYQEFQRATSSARISTSGTDQIYALSQSVSTLKSLEKELDTIIPKIKK